MFEEMGDVITDTEISGLFQGITEVEKATAYKVNVGFDRRLRIWQYDILPGRMHEIQQTGSVEFVERMRDLLMADGSRLTNKAIRDEKTSGKVKMVSRIEVVDTIMKETMDIYTSEINRLKLLETGDE